MGVKGADLPVEISDAGGNTTVYPLMNIHGICSAAELQPFTVAAPALRRAGVQRNAAPRRVGRRPQTSMGDAQHVQIRAASGEDFETWEPVGDAPPGEGAYEYLLANVE